MKAFKEFLKKYHIVFFVVLVMNIYFLVTEILNFAAAFSALSLFTIVLYSSTIIYMSLMELYKTLNRETKWAYIFTLCFLLVNAVTLPLTILFANVFDSLSPVYTLSGLVNGKVSMIILILVYLGYLAFRFVLPIINSIRAKAKNDDYTRARNFGSIVSGGLTFITSFVGTFLAYSAMMLSEQMMLLNMNSVPFLIGAAVVFILTIIFVVKCIKGIINNKKSGLRE